MATEAAMVERIKEILKQVLDTDEDVKAWLNEPHPDLGMKTAQQCIDNGQTSVVLDMLEGALAGNVT